MPRPTHYPNARLDTPATWHPAITLDRLITATQQDDYTGYCLQCGTDAENVEPDAREYRCQECGAHAVYGAEELLIVRSGL